MRGGIEMFNLRNLKLQRTLLFKKRRIWKTEQDYNIITDTAIILSAHQIARQYNLDIISYDSDYYEECKIVIKGTKTINMLYIILVVLLLLLIKFPFLTLKFFTLLSPSLWQFEQILLLQFLTDKYMSIVHILYIY